jgi:hypothetical protein
MQEKFFNKGQIGTTLTWFVGFIVIFFVMWIFIAIAGYMVAEKKVSPFKGGESGIEIINAHYSDKLILFLNTKINYNGRDILVKDFLTKEADNSDKEKKFQEVAKEFMKNNFPVAGGGFYRTWLRIYETNDEIAQHNCIGLCGSYSVEDSSRGGKGGVLCDSLEENSVLLKFYLTTNKKIALCAN